MLGYHRRFRMRLLLRNRPVSCECTACSLPVYPLDAVASWPSILCDCCHIVYCCGQCVCHCECDSPAWPEMLA